MGIKQWRSRAVVREVEHDSIAPEVDGQEDRFTAVARVKLLADRNRPLEERERITPEVAAHHLIVARFRKQCGSSGGDLSERSHPFGDAVPTVLKGGHPAEVDELTFA